MSSDFRTKQIRLNRLVTSGSSPANRPHFSMYHSSAATNFTGGTDADLFAAVGRDVYSFFSGSKGSRDRGGERGVALFGGDVVISGTIYADKQVIEVDETVTGSLSVSGSLFVSQSARIKQGLSIEEDRIAGGHVALEIDSESTSATTLYSHGFAAGFFEQDISSGYGLRVTRNIAEAGANPLVSVVNYNAANTNHSMFIDHDSGGGVGLYVDSEATTHNALYVAGMYPAAFVQDIDDGYGLRVIRDLNDAGSNPLVNFIDDNTANSQTTLRVQQDGSGDILNLHGGGLEVFTVLSSGKVGILEPTPLHAELVVGDGTVDRTIMINAGSALSGSLAFQKNNGSTAAALVHDKNEDIWLVNSGSNKNIGFKINKGGTEEEVLDIDGATGCVGIGASTVQWSELEIRRTGASTVLISAGASSSGSLAFRKTSTGATAAALVLDREEDLALVNSGSNKDMRFLINKGGTITELMTLDGSAGRVGIGDATPSAKVSIAGVAGETLFDINDGTLNTFRVDADGTTGGVPRVAIGSTNSTEKAHLAIRAIPGIYDDATVIIEAGPVGSGSLAFTKGAATKAALVLDGDENLALINSGAQSEINIRGHNGSKAVDLLRFRTKRFNAAAWDEYGPQILFLSGANSSGASDDPYTWRDTNFYVSGAIGLKDSNVYRGTAVFGGDMVCSGTIYDGSGSPVGGGGWTDDGTVVRLSAASDLVGIGTASPKTEVHVGDGTASRTILIDAGAAGSGSLAFGKSGTTAAALVLDGNEELRLVNSGSNEELKFVVNSGGTINTAMAMGAMDDGGVGVAIGARTITGGGPDWERPKHGILELGGNIAYGSWSNPTLMLTVGGAPGSGSIGFRHIAGPTAAALTWDIGGELRLINSGSDEDIVFSTNFGGTVTENIRIQGASKWVGIGTAAPAAMLDVAGSIFPSTDNSHDLGSITKRWANIYTGDLHLRNDQGNWTIQEDADKLIVINNLTGKKYKMMLEPLEENE